MSDTPMTGATERLRAELETAGWWIDVCPDGDLYGQLETDSGLKEFRIDPATLDLLTRHTVPDAELIESVWRLKEISEYASSVLILEGGFGRSTAETKRLTALLDARTLPHDWERTDAWLAQQEGGDGNG